MNEGGQQWRDTNTGKTYGNNNKRDVNMFMNNMLWQVVALDGQFPTSIDSLGYVEDDVLWLRQMKRAHIFLFIVFGTLLFVGPSMTCEHCNFSWMPYTSIWSLVYITLFPASVVLFYVKNTNTWFVIKSKSRIHDMLSSTLCCRPSLIIFICSVRDCISLLPINC